MNSHVYIEENGTKYFGKKSGSRAARTSSYGADNPVERGKKKGKELRKNKKL